MSASILKGSVTTLVLKLIEENHKMYGYEITKMVKERTKGKWELTEAALYPTLKKLESEGLLDTETEMVDGRLRKYYFLSENGSKEVDVKFSQLKESMLALQSVLGIQKVNAKYKPTSCDSIQNSGNLLLFLWHVLAVFNF